MSASVYLIAGTQEIVYYSVGGVVVLCIILISATNVVLLRRMSTLQQQVHDILSFPNANNGDSIIEMKTIRRTEDPFPFSIE